MSHNANLEMAKRALDKTIKGEGYHQCYKRKLTFQEEEFFIGKKVVNANNFF